MDNIKDIYGYVTDRIQKLTAALYRVTDLLSDKEPIKWTLRDKALSLYDDLVSVKDIKNKDSLLDNSLKNFTQIIKSLELVSAGVCISNLNFEILKREYLFLRNFIEGKKTDMAYDSKMLLELEKLGSSYSSWKPNSQAGQNQGVFEKTVERKELFPKSPINSAYSKETSLQEINPQSRKGKVLDFLRGGPAKSVNEIAVIFNGEISEKSIQRDLLDLVKMGKISAIGDKRWRKYQTIDLSNRIS